ncbi:sulfite reductase subunit beta [Vararia minispora EC-137]|uniref:Sulfite reductase subunit beta n=1 Tax=Vararia minispora EC-137 TaxID=1314806 RepID=A0ACB8QFA5_9AGAM|nr:sulfite reductase subunit beta [Vararia minispora EC-137]
MCSKPAVAAVARIAHLSSDVVISSTSASWASPPSSSFGTSIISLAEDIDVGSTLLRAVTVPLVAYATNSSPALSHLFPYLFDLSSKPIVFHVAADGDLSHVIVLRSAVPFFIHSASAQQAHDNALLASRLARTESKAVIHVFHVSSSDEEVEEVMEELVKPFLLAEQHSPARVGTGGNLALDAYELATAHTLALLGRPLRPFTIRGDDTADFVLITLGRSAIALEQSGATWIDISLVSPFPIVALLRAINPAAKHVFVLEQIQHWPMKWTPIFLDVISALQQLTGSRPSVTSVYLGDTSGCIPTDVSALLAAVSASRLQLGATPSITHAKAETPSIPKHESSYTNLLNHLFGERLQVINSPEIIAAHGELATRPEFALGRVRGELQQRAELISVVETLLLDSRLPQNIHSLLSQWLLAKDDGKKSRALGQEIIVALEAADVKCPDMMRVLRLGSHLPAFSRWIIGSDAWSYDIGASGLHHAITSGLNVNVLVIDTVPYSKRQEVAHRKQDVGLYAMNHGDVFVASIAIYSSYGQVLQALAEADRFPGPSIVLAYLPYTSLQTTALQILKETKNAVDSGYWPLYRWNPSKESEGLEPFLLDSDMIKKELQVFLDRYNHLSQLVRTKPEIAAELVGNFGDRVKEARKARAQQAFDNLLSGIDASPVLILYASDGGNAEKKAKRLAGRAMARGLPTTIMTMDAYGFDSLFTEDRHTIFITSTAGQGEPPQNGRQFFKSLNSALLLGTAELRKLKYTVFGMGDSHYWPRAEDFIYHNRPGKELDAKLAQLGAERFADLGLGDDQAADGTETGYKLWEPLLWRALGVDALELAEEEPEPITAEHIKAASLFLRGTIAEGFTDLTTGGIAASDTPLTKMHGIYQQEDRDVREERQVAGVEPAYIFMVRLRLPAGVVTPEQWLAVDQIADEHGAGHFKITTRQTFQLHGVLKRHVKPTIKKVNQALMRTVGTCGDACQNVTLSSMPALSRLHAQTFQLAKTLSDRFAPQTTAYHEIWLDQKMVAGDALKAKVQEPFYGSFYMPRKFKIAFAFPPTNDVDVFAHDIGMIAIVDDKDSLAGFNVLCGGGMGTTHGNKNTYPRIGSMLGFITPDQVIGVCEQILIFQRDNGNRKDRKNARLKYTIDRVGFDFFKSEIEKRSGIIFREPRSWKFERNIDNFGWQTGDDGLHHFTTFVENGRVQDEPGSEFKTAFREIAKVHKGRFRLTCNQHVIITEVKDQDLPEIKRILAKYKLDNLSYSGLRLAGAACVALPTCGLAMAESERYLPVLMDKVEAILEENGLRNDSIVMRMSGCPNGCSRPYLGEIAFAGKAPGTYTMLLGGGYYGQRLNKIYRESVTEPEILAILKPMIRGYALKRHEGEHFGDFVIRAGYIAPSEPGKSWYERIGGEGIHRTNTLEVTT